MPGERKARGPAAQLAKGRSFYAGLDLDVRHFAAMWHSFNVGQLLANDLNAIGRRHGLSIADFHLLGALMIDPATPMRATDLAAALNVSAAVLSGRIARLAREGLLRRGRAAGDRRSAPLTLTAAGAEKVHVLGAALQADARFVRHYHRMDEGDRAALDRIMADLHEALDRDHLPIARPDT